MRYAHRDAFGTTYTEREYQEIVRAQADNDAYWQRLRDEFAARMDELDAVYQRDTRPCLEGKPSVKITTTQATLF